MKRLLSVLAASALLLMVVASPASATVKVTICHSTSAAGNPFVAIVVDENSGYSPHLSDNAGNNPLAGHEQDFLLIGEHTGPECAAAASPTPTPTPTPTPVVTPSPTPTPVVTPSPTPTPTPVITPSPTPTPSEPPVIGQFDVETCPETGEPVAAGTSVIRIRGGLLLIMLLTVRVDGEVVTLRDVFDDGTVGELFVTPGLHTVTISNAADTEVLAEGEVFCPECNPLVITPPPTVTPTLPASDTVAADEAPVGFPVVPLVIAFLAVLSAAALVLTPKRR